MIFDVVFDICKFYKMFIVDVYILVYSMQNLIDLIMMLYNKCKFLSYIYNIYFIIKQYRQERIVLRNVYDFGLWFEMMNIVNKI